MALNITLSGVGNDAREPIERPSGCISVARTPNPVNKTETLSPVLSDQLKLDIFVIRNTFHEPQKILSYKGLLDWLSKRESYSIKYCTNDIYSQLTDAPSDAQLANSTQGQEGNAENITSPYARKLQSLLGILFCCILAVCLLTALLLRIRGLHASLSLPGLNAAGVIIIIDSMTSVFNTDASLPSCIVRRLASMRTQRLYRESAIRVHFPYDVGDTECYVKPPVPSVTFGSNVYPVDSRVRNGHGPTGGRYGKRGIQTGHSLHDLNYLERKRLNALMQMGPLSQQEQAVVHSTPKERLSNGCVRTVPASRHAHFAQDSHRTGTTRTLHPSTLTVHRCDISWTPKCLSGIRCSFACDTFGCFFRNFKRLSFKFYLYRSAVTHSWRLAAVPSEESTRAGILPGCPSLDRGSREAEVGFEPRTLRYSVFIKKNEELLDFSAIFSLLRSSFSTNEGEVSK
ncbi:hypothetical protein T265_05494 [Opisthorchis viverrini]|uniref:Uncharacterized protein n=1 Tax=Opisthorchis viverrini TaxID=6198 RepID=A0A074ZK76_OPIVI|nr:hypothetical protein T265_05494 [Opisthorchis viverrini]KER27456.1 hypothetical protein T265_05494 [Opisthorchis viverrini]